MKKYPLKILPHIKNILKAHIFNFLHDWFRKCYKINKISRALANNKQKVAILSGIGMVLLTKHFFKKIYLNTSSSGLIKIIKI